MLAELATSGSGKVWARFKDARLADRKSVV